jgi:hypothetical protein
MPHGDVSEACSNASVPMNAPTTSQTQDMHKPNRIKL